MVQIENAIGLLNIVDDLTKGNVLRLAVSGATHITMDEDGSVFAWRAEIGKSPVSGEDNGGTSMYREGGNGGWLAESYASGKALFFLGDVIVERFPGIDYTQMCFEVIDSDISAYIAGWEA